MNRKSNERGAYSVLNNSNLELAKITREQMTRSQALQTLNLDGVPSPKRYEEKVKELLRQYTDSDDVTKIAGVHAAHSRLHQDHQDAVKEMRQSIDTAYSTFQDTITTLAEAAPDLDKTFKKYGKDLIEKSRDYCKNLAEPNADMEGLESEYKRKFQQIVHDASAAVGDDVRGEYAAALKTLEAQVSVAYDQILEAEMEEVVICDQVELFRNEFNFYLRDILTIKETENAQLSQAHQEASRPLLAAPRYQKDLISLHDKLEKIGKKYFDALKESGDVKPAQQEFNQKFKKAVEEAKQAFAKVPGIWANLNCILQFLAVITIIPAIVIIFGMEKTEDRNRLFHGAPLGELNMQEIWSEMQMDVLPDPEGDSPKRNKQV